MYTAQGTLTKDKQVAGYLPLVKRIAYLLMARLPASVEVDDLIQNGLIGLLDAMDRFEDGMGAQFETYAVQRIRGSMLDGLRENDWLPRSVRKEMRRVEEAIRVLEHENGRPPSEAELAKALDMPLADYQKLLLDARGHQLVYIDEVSDGNGEDYLDRHAAASVPDPLSILEEAGTRQALITAIEALPEREKMMMSLYYEQDMNLREIGEVMGVTESRVCQLHSQAVARLRTAVTGQGKTVRGRRGAGAAA
ncbi:MAG: RNA polymerase sigma factor FliA [Sulfuritalea sp.]|jgi:RNA polymerase sigma factor for flagellar operon FliA|nr:RNA polymerase sigma factor FliA [Sulfuritalea sp.]MBK8762257.1 RNA polymerase sigma factor FliA [Sulfuritalea sp.]MBK9348807.1 RNA polymerase sigma factor FliA [Sulfuritalea sp.]MBP6636418.1 RNA polymerase sigma factor FliA [Sulfuritalea sp.]MBP7422006.1 RNA polymerase sigma factor FliA [Sulfuritalea sp.]